MAQGASVAGMSDRLNKYRSARLPRYTSYPTAPHFSDKVDGTTYAAWLSDWPGNEPASLYLHVPFCHQLCWYCGCHTTVTQRPERIADYAALLRQEVSLIGAHLPIAPPLTHLHFGGGTPTILAPEDFTALMREARRVFDFQDDAEIAMEIDPRSLSDAMIAAMAGQGVNRVSLGVQDFTPAVQEAVNRVQPYEVVEDSVARLRAAGAEQISFDLMYGLPKQTVEDLCRSLELAVSLSPDRISLFGYAHVPWMKKHQQMIQEADLPDVETRRQQNEAGSRHLKTLGFVQIGMDHFARPDDPMALAAARGELGRNFQGYTTDKAPALLGLGASAIGYLPQGYVQNHADIANYRRDILAGRLPTQRGIALCQDDRLRRDLIMQVMCAERVEVAAICADHDQPLEALADAFDGLGALSDDGLVEWDGRTLSLTDEGQAFRRSVAACFDAFLGRGSARHSVAV